MKQVFLIEIENLTISSSMLSACLIEYLNKLGIQIGFPKVEEVTSNLVLKFLNGELTWADN